MRIQFFFSDQTQLTAVRNKFHFKADIYTYVFEFSRVKYVHENMTWYITSIIAFVNPCNVIVNAAPFKDFLTFQENFVNILYIITVA